jgi:diphthine-ammonia ligase
MSKAMRLGRTDKGNAVVSWTGGKDGCYSCYKAINDGYNVTHLLNFRNTKKTGSHELSHVLIQAQSRAIGIPLLQRDFYSYEEEFKRAVFELRAQDERIDAAIFGHIETHKPLVERICQDLHIDLLLPLWKQNPRSVLAEIIDSGFEVVVISVKDDLMGKEWLGRRIDEGFISDLSNLNESINPCGENGEFHTFVTDGPIFKKRIIIDKSEPILREGYWFLNISEFAIRDK